MREYAKERFNNNIGLSEFLGEGPFEIPKMRPEKWEPMEFAPFNLANNCRTGRERTGLHFFMDDYRFDKVWYFLKRYIEMFGQFGAVTTPDWSMYTDWPVAMQIWNHYRKHFVGAILQENGVKAYPTIGWSDEDSFEWCFDGDPVGGTVAVSSVGTQRSANSKRLFLLGYREMLRRLKPETVLFYGSVPEECDGGNIVRLEAFQKRFNKRRGNA